MATSHNTPSQHDLDLLSAYIDGALTDRQHADLERRLGSDPVLRATVDDLRQTVALLRTLPRVKAPRSFALDPVLFRRELPWWRRFPLETTLQIAGALGTAASVIVVAAALILGYGTGDSSVSEPRDASSVAAGSAATEDNSTAIAYAGDDLLQTTISAQTMYYGTLESETAAAPLPAAIAAPDGMVETSAVAPELESEAAGGAIAQSVPPSPALDEPAAEGAPFAAPPGADAQEEPMLQASAEPEQAGMFAAEAAMAAPPVGSEPAANSAGEMDTLATTDTSAADTQALREVQETVTPSSAEKLPPTATRTPTLAPSPEPAHTLIPGDSDSPSTPGASGEAVPTSDDTGTDWPVISIAAVLGFVSLTLFLIGYWRARRA